MRGGRQLICVLSIFALSAPGCAAEAAAAAATSKPEAAAAARGSAAAAATSETPAPATAAHTAEESQPAAPGEGQQSGATGPIVVPISPPASLQTLVDERSETIRRLWPSSMVASFAVACACW